MKRIVVLGAGESGTGAAILAKRKGMDPFVSDSGSIQGKYKEMLDAEGISWEEGRHTESAVLAAGEIIKSPGIPENTPIISKARAKGIPIISEIEFAARYTQAKMICITGSNGKTTTTSLIYYIFKSAGYNVGLAGNIGRSFALQIAEGAQFDYYILELSSFQLDDMYRFRANIAVLLNITPDHLDRYGFKMQNYVDAKMRITRNQTPEDAFVYWQDDPVIRKELERHPPVARRFPFALRRDDENCVAYVENGKVVFTGPLDFNLEQEELALTGIHNLYNSMAAGISARLAGIKKEAIREALSTFQGVPHRLEYAGCWYALEIMKTPVVLILGGKDKGNDYSELDELVRERVRGFVFLGVDNCKLHGHFDPTGLPTADSRQMDDAVRKAFALAQPGDTVLLSPCCASFDLFKNMADRGNQFKEAVKNLA